MAIFDWFDSIWYNLFGMSWMFSGTHRLVLTLLFVILISGFLTIKQIKMSFNVAFLFCIAYVFLGLSFILTAPKTQYKILNEEKMAKVFQNNQFIDITLKSKYSSDSENLIVKNNDNEDVLDFNKITSYIASSNPDLFYPTDYPISEITLSKGDVSLDRKGRLIIVDKSGKIVEKSKNEKEKNLKIDGIYYGDLTYEVRIGKITESRTEKFIKVVVNNSKSRSDIDKIKELLNESD